MKHRTNKNAKRYAVFFVPLLLIVWIGYLVTPYLRGTRLITSSGPKSLSIEEIPAPSPEDHYKWKSSSPYTVVNYFSLDCPHCRKVDAIENAAEEKYKSAFTLIYRHSPLPSIQPLSPGKAVIAECVYEQTGDTGMFSFISDLYDHYQPLATDNAWTELLGQGYIHDKTTFHACIVSNIAKEKIEHETRQALAYGVAGTPTIAIFKNGVLVKRFDTTGEGSVKRIMDSLIGLR